MRLAAILQSELRRSGRRERTFWLRTAYVSLLATLMALAWLAEVDGDWAGQEMAGRRLFVFFSWIQFVLLNAAAPLFLAGAVSDDADRGNLPLLLSTPYNSLEMVAGKLLGGLVPVLLLLLSGLPVLCLLLLLGGIAPREVMLSYGLTMVAAFWGGAFALWGSSSLRPPWRSVLLSYGAVLSYVAVPLVFAGWSWEKGASLSPYAGFVSLATTHGVADSWPLLQGCAVAAVLFLLVVAATSLRLERLRHCSGRRVPVGGPAPAGLVMYRRPEAWDRENPFLVRECGSRQQALRRGLRFSGWLVSGLVVTLCLASDLFITPAGSAGAGLYLLYPVLLAVVLSVPLLLSVRSFAAEHHAGVFPVLMSTPLPGRVWMSGKVQAIGFVAVPLLCVPAFLSAGLALLGVLPWSWAVVSALQGITYGLYLALPALLCGLWIQDQAWAVFLALALAVMLEACLLPLWLVLQAWGWAGSPEHLFGVYWAFFSWTAWNDPALSTSAFSLSFLMHLLLHGVVVVIFLVFLLRRAGALLGRPWDQ